ncbi:reverse transcriptase [Cucumis melo var. makuwa]|nr:reverse transcriptase [Cucumis melo var. makuwa]
MKVAKSKEGISMSQRKYTIDLLTKAGCRSANTPIEFNCKLGNSDDQVPVDKEQYQQFLQAFCEKHMEAVNKILRYLKTTPGILSKKDLTRSICISYIPSSNKLLKFSPKLAERKFVSSKKLQSLRVFLKLESWKKSCIFKEASIFEDVLEVGVLEEKVSIFEGVRLQELKSLLSLGRILSKSSGVKDFPTLQMKRTPLFIEFPGFYVDKVLRDEELAQIELGKWDDDLRGGMW